ncbi:MAG TPA: hypothetical protein VM307_10325, partial [Egibacteraceae bacterium]|nr:hypothetical protein [Egibacteraceae bacterium]
ANRPRGDRSGADRTDGDDKGAQPAPATPTPPAPAYRTAADVSDPEGDRGRAPAYADLRRVLIESDGANARVSIVVAGRLPATLAEGEVQGIGVDFYRTNDRESDYQLFADGGSTGWEAYLHTPSGIGRFEGSFRMGGQMLVFEVPWSSLGGRKAADVSAFVDWSAQDRPFNRTGGDRAPDQGRFRVLP